MNNTDHDLKYLEFFTCPPAMSDYAEVKDKKTLDFFRQSLSPIVALNFPAFLAVYWLTYECIFSFIRANLLERSNHDLRQTRRLEKP